MNEQEVMEKLQALTKQYAGEADKKVAGARSIYLGGGWWGEYQPQLLVDAYEALLQNPTVGHIHVPLLHQYKGLAFGDDYKPDFEWATMTYRADIRAIDNSDLMVGLFPAEDQDTGTAMEVGYAAGSNKPVVNVYTGDWNANPINLMISIGADSYMREVKELTTYNFLDISPKLYEGELI